ncbi:MAG: hypothetical protein JXB48_21360 [Candidatus Latescibacteria bacterium]|nr:hypothetical protein [Candidatus Latescibacterota bacterium]
MKKIGFAYNLKKTSAKDTDIHAEYETQETIETISRVLSELGNIIQLPCDEHIIQRILEEKPDCVFNIAEGWGGRDRESFVPVICSMLDIPYTGSDAVTLGITMDKVLSKQIARDAGLRTADYILCTEEPEDVPDFGFPAFVKPNWDGSSRGISKDSLVHDMKTLREQVGVILHTYRQPALVEPYLNGRDFCVGLLGNCNPQLLQTCEVLLGHEDGIPFFSYEYKRRDTDRLDFVPDIPEHVLREMENMAQKLWRVLGCRDYSRFDFRTDGHGVPYFLEINALPGLSPVSGIFVRQAKAAGIFFDLLIKKIMERIITM